MYNFRRRTQTSRKWCDEQHQHKSTGIDTEIVEIQDNYVQDILNQPGDRPVFNLALMPAEGLAAVTQDVVGPPACKTY